MDRYFIVVYSAQGGVKGNVFWTVSNNGYVNNKQIKDYIHKEHLLDNIVVENIIELSESDYNDWIK